MKIFTPTNFLLLGATALVFMITQHLVATVVFAVIGYFVIKKETAKEPLPAPSKITPNMIHPINKSMTTVQAKMAFKEFMLETGHLDKDELAEHARYLADEIREHTEYLREEVSEKKDEIRELKKELTQLKKNLKKGKDDDEKEETKDEIDTSIDDIDTLNQELDEHIANQKAFKEDKRQFLCDYINQQLG